MQHNFQHIYIKALTTMHFNVTVWCYFYTGHRLLMLRPICIPTVPYFLNFTTTPYIRTSFNAISPIKSNWKKITCKRKKYSTFFSENCIIEYIWSFHYFIKHHEPKRIIEYASIHVVFWLHWKTLFNAKMMLIFPNTNTKYKPCIHKIAS